jgi:CRP/FNR family transcriptional regulator
MDKKSAVKNFLLYFLGSADNALIVLLEAISNVIEKERGQNIFFKDDPAKYVYFLLDSSVNLYRLSESGKKAIIKIVKKGEVFADIVLFGEKTYPVNAEARDNCKLLAIDAQRFKNIILSDKTLCEKFISMLIKKIKYLVNIIESIKLDDAKTRLLNYLYKKRDQSLNNTVELNMTKKSLAETLGITGETISRLLKKLSKEGLIKVDRNKIIFLKII